MFQYYSTEHGNEANEIIVTGKTNVTHYKRISEIVKVGCKTPNIISIFLGKIFACAA